MQTPTRPDITPELPPRDAEYKRGRKRGIWIGVLATSATWIILGVIGIATEDTTAPTVPTDTNVVYTAEDVVNTMFAGGTFSDQDFQNFCDGYDLLGDARSYRLFVQGAGGEDFTRPTTREVFDELISRCL